MTLSTSSNFVYESGNITIACNATSQVNFSLFIDGTFDSTKFERITAHQLTPLAMAYVFSNATIDDNGTTFMCYGFNDTVESNSSIFYLNVYCKCIIIKCMLAISTYLDAPRFTQGGVNTTILLELLTGSNASINVSVMANPPLTYFNMSTDADNITGIVFEVCFIFSCITTFVLYRIQLALYILYLDIPVTVATILSLLLILKALLN